MKLKSESQSFQRKRGRPAGKNRAPLSQEERRARNAQYEKERRDEHAQAAAMLAEAAGCEPNLPLMLLLDRVTSFLKKEANRDPSDDVARLRNLNENLLHQIITLEERLQCEDIPKLSPYEREEIPVRTHTNQVLTKRVKLERLQCEENCKLNPYGHEEVPVRTHSNELLRKRVKMEQPSPAIYPVQSPEPRPEQAATSNTSLTLASVLDDVISLEEEKVTKLQVPDQSQWSLSSVLDDIISLEEERKVPDVYYQWSATDFSLELL